MMTFKDYQREARKTAIYPELMKVIYPALGLCGESGEVAEKIKKIIRDSGQDYPQNMFRVILNVDEEKKQLLKKELGDVLWYIANLSYDLDLDMNEIAEENIAKLKDRQDRGKLHGSGDNR